jgi:hypothetical protein
MIELIVAIHDFIEKYVSKPILILNFTLTELYNNNKT